VREVHELLEAASGLAVSLQDSGAATGANLPPLRAAPTSAAELAHRRALALATPRVARRCLGFHVMTACLVHRRMLPGGACAVARSPGGPQPPLPCRRETTSGHETICRTPRHQRRSMAQTCLPRRFRPTVTMVATSAASTAQRRRSTAPLITGQTKTTRSTIDSGATSAVVPNVPSSPIPLRSGSHPHQPPACRATGSRATGSRVMGSRVMEGRATESRETDM
jgi:hypothetical protein